MKTLVINGSPRKNGTTAKQLKIAIDKLKMLNKSEIEYINISDYKINFCSGCFECRPDKRCIIDDDGKALSDKIDKADNLIIGTPTYWGNMTGQLKTLFDRSVTIMNYFTPLRTPRNKHKKAIVMTNSRSSFPEYLKSNQSAQTLKSVTDILKKGGGYRIVGTVNLPNTLYYKEIPVSMIKKIEKLVDKMYK